MKFKTINNRDELLTLLREVDNQLTAGHPVHVLVSPVNQPLATAAQKSFYYAVLRQVASDTGNSVKVLDAYFRSSYLGTKTLSIGDISVAHCSDFIAQCLADIDNNMGITLSDSVMSQARQVETAPHLISHGSRLQ